MEKIVQLADYRKLMFASAIHAGFILRYQKSKPKLEHTVVYETPKVSRFDRRRGVIVVEPDDQKIVRQRDVLEASLRDKKRDQSRLPALWSRKFWGSRLQVFRSVVCIARSCLAAAKVRYATTCGGTRGVPTFGVHC